MAYYQETWTLAHFEEKLTYRSAYLPRKGNDEKLYESFTQIKSLEIIYTKQNSGKITHIKLVLYSQIYVCIIYLSLDHRGYEI